MKYVFVKGKTQAPDEVIVGLSESKIILIHTVHQLNVNSPSLVALRDRHYLFRKTTLQESIKGFELISVKESIVYASDVTNVVRRPRETQTRASHQMDHVCIAVDCISYLERSIAMT